MSHSGNNPLKTTQDLQHHIIPRSKRKTYHHDYRLVQPDSLNKNTPIHTEERRFKNSTRYNFKKHLRKSYECEICGYHLTTKDSLKRHLSTHTVVKPYQCKSCDDTFTAKTSLVTHMRKHTGEKPYECRICGNFFAHKSTLTRHLGVHVKGKGYKCEICCTTFTRRRDLLSHYEKAHRELDDIKNDAPEESRREYIKQEEVDVKEEGDAGGGDLFQLESSDLVEIKEEVIEENYI